MGDFSLKMLKLIPIQQNEKMLEKIVGKTALAIGAKVHKNHLEFKSFFHLDPHNTIGSLLQKNTPRLLLALENNLLAYLGLAFDISSIIEVVKEFSSPQKMEEINAAFQEMFQMPFLQVASLFSGELSIGVTGNLDATKFNPQSTKKVDYSLTIGITDKEKARNLLDKLVKLEILPIQNNNGVFQIQTPQNKTFSIVVTNNCIVVSSDERVITNLENPDLGDALKQFIKLTRPTVAFNIDLITLGYLFVIFKQNNVAEKNIEVKDAVAAKKTEPQNTNPSPQYLAKKKELDNLQEEWKQAVQKLQDEQNAKLDVIRTKITKLDIEFYKNDKNNRISFANHFGQMTISAHKVEHGVVVNGGLFVRVPMKNFIRDSLSHMRDIRYAQAVNYSEVYQLSMEETKVNQLYQEKEQKLNEEYSAKEQQLRQELQQIGENSSN